jgi:hypothetical protein
MPQTAGPPGRVVPESGQGVGNATQSVPEGTNIVMAPSQPQGFPIVVERGGGVAPGTRHVTQPNRHHESVNVALAQCAPGFQLLLECRSVALVGRGDRALAQGDRSQGSRKRDALVSRHREVWRHGWWIIW